MEETNNSINNIILDLISNYDVNIKDEYIDKPNNDIQDNTIEDNDNIQIDINDYIPADEEVELSETTGLLNIFTCYFKQLFEAKQNSTMFDSVDIEKKEGTNRCLEFLYEEMFKFNNSKECDKDMLYDLDDVDLNIDEVKELYMLSIDSVPLYVCKFLLPLLKYLSTQKWNEINWTILPIKG